MGQSQVLIFRETRTGFCNVEYKPFVKGHLIIIREHLNSPTFVAGFVLLNHFKASTLFVQCFIELCVCFCSFSLSQLCCLSFFSLRLMIELYNQIRLTFAHQGKECLILIWFFFSIPFGCVTKLLISYNGQQTLHRKLEIEHMM